MSHRNSWTLWSVLRHGRLPGGGGHPQRLLPHLPHRHQLPVRHHLHVRHRPSHLPSGSLPTHWWIQNLKNSLFLSFRITKITLFSKLKYPDSFHCQWFEFNCFNFRKVRIIRFEFRIFELNLNLNCDRKGLWQQIFEHNVGRFFYFCILYAKSFKWIF